MMLRIRAGIETSVSAALELERPVTASFGVASCPPEAQQFGNLVEYADNALYRAKGQGKNRVELWKEIPGCERKAED